MYVSDTLLYMHIHVYVHVHVYTDQLPWHEPPSQESFHGQNGRVCPETWNPVFASMRCGIIINTLTMYTYMLYISYQDTLKWGHISNGNTSWSKGQIMNYDHVPIYNVFNSNPFSNHRRNSVNVSEFIAHPLIVSSTWVLTCLCSDCDNLIVRWLNLVVWNRSWSWDCVRRSEKSCVTQ